MSFAMWENRLNEQIINMKNGAIQIFDIITELTDLNIL